MSLKNLDYWYDGCQRRYLEQLVRAFSGFQYQTGFNGNGSPQLVIVPCTLAQTNKQVANIIRNNSENALISAPRITIWQTGLKYRNEDLQNIGHVDTLQVTERKIDHTTGKYTSERGNSYTVQRLMPRPFMMEIQVDIWTTNQDQKHQLIEQILPIIVPQFDIQNSQNPLDWAALTMVKFIDFTMSSKTIPVGNDDSLEVATIRLEVPIWFSTPAKVKEQSIIKNIITNIFDEETSDFTGNVPTGTLLSQEITTYGDFHISVNGSSITLLENDAPTETSWVDLFFKYGEFRPAQSQLRLYYTLNFETGPFVSGTIQYDTSSENKLFWQIDPDTLPANTLAPINALIDPLKTYPGHGLPTPYLHSRYMLINDIGHSSVWGNLTARANDIIENVNGVWVVSFASNDIKASHLVLNLFSGRQLRWTGSEWVMNIDTTYGPGYWRLYL